jgi:hypothetical protein
VDWFGFFGLVLEVVIESCLSGSLDLRVEILPLDSPGQVDETLQVIRVQVVVETDLLLLAVKHCVLGVVRRLNLLGGI